MLRGASGPSPPPLAVAGAIDFSDVHGEHKPWKDIFGAGQGVGAIDRIAPMAAVAAQVAAEYAAAGGRDLAGAALAG